MTWKFLTIFASFLLFTSCQQGPRDGQSSSGSRSTLPGSNGGTLDIIVVAKKSTWQQKGGKTFRKYFTKSQYGLPQPEPRFTVRQVEPEEFNELLQRTRSIVRLKKGAQNLSIVKNKWAYPQRVITFSAPDSEQLAKLIDEKQKQVRQQIRAMEINRIQQRMQDRLQKNPSPVLGRHHIKMDITKSFELEIEKENTLVFWKKTPKTDQGLIIHFRPLPENQGIIGKDIIPIRDSLTKKYIPAEREGSYMVTEDIIKPEITNTKIEGRFAQEARGLWRTENDIMGGSFVSYTIYDEEHDQIVYLDAFLYAPDKKKRNMLFELETMLKSVEFME